MCYDGGSRKDSGFGIRDSGFGIGCPRAKGPEWEFGIRASGFGVWDWPSGAPRARNRDSGFGIRDSGFGTRDSGFGIRDLGLGAWGLKDPEFEFGTRD